MVIIKNEWLTVVVAEHGAELQSIKKEGKELLWQGDAKFWGRRSPVLFPIVGRVWDGKFRLLDKTYEMGQHGFARDMDFVVVGQSENAVDLELRSNAQTLALFPYNFVLTIGYELKENALLVKWTVKNTGANYMFFQIGAHPAFNLPDLDLTTNDRCYFAFDCTHRMLYTQPELKGCVTPEVHELKLDADGLMKLDATSFDNCDTYVFENAQTQVVKMLNRNREPYITVKFDAPLVAIWAPMKSHKDCPFVCIEPWYGRCDYVGYEGDFASRPWINRLRAGEQFNSCYSIIAE